FPFGFLASGESSGPAGRGGGPAPVVLSLDEETSACKLNPGRSEPGAGGVENQRWAAARRSPAASAAVRNKRPRPPTGAATASGLGRRGKPGTGQPPRAHPVRFDMAPGLPKPTAAVVTCSPGFMALARFAWSGPVLALWGLFGPGPYNGRA